MFSIKPHRTYVRQNSRSQPINKSRKLTVAISEAWKNFCTTSSFAGFQYVYRPKRTIFDILIWTTLMIFLITCATLFVADFLERYHSMSTKTLIRTQHSPITRPPFPSIAACLTGRISKSRVNDFIEKYILSNENLKQINVTNFVRILNVFETSGIGIKESSKVFGEYNMTMRDMVYMTTADCEEDVIFVLINSGFEVRTCMSNIREVTTTYRVTISNTMTKIFTVCRWAGEIVPCTKIFKKTMAFGGFCCSFNYPIPHNAVNYRELLHVRTFGLKGGLSFAFKIFPNEDFFNKQSYSNTLRVAIHDPFSFPTLNNDFMLISKSTETSVEINSVYNIADVRIKNVATDDRDCIFKLEKKLKYFRRYSNNNCMIECQMNRAFEQCGCVAHYFPSDESEVCDMEQTLCSIKTRYVGGGKGGEIKYVRYTDCDCPDDCTVLKMNYKIDSWELVPDNKYTVDDFYNSLTANHGVVHISLSKSTTSILDRKLSFDGIQLASNIGGIVSLFLGCSFISVIEILYFLVIRTRKLYKSTQNE